VYIFRENKFTVAHGALGLLNLDTSTENNLSGALSGLSCIATLTILTNLLNHMACSVNADKEEESSDVNVKSKEATDGGIRSPVSYTDDFAAVKRFVDFKIVVGNYLIVLPDHLGRTYYDLCCARKAFLHGHLKKISLELSIAVILETINIAEGIRASSPASLEDLVDWKKALQSFEHMGMDVAFMCKRIEDVLCLLNAPSVEPEGYEELKLEHAHLAKKLEAVESKMSILKDTLEEMDLKIETIEASTKTKDQVVQNLATAPW
jgi:hypothetical protein